jgi:cytochrome b561
MNSNRSAVRYTLIAMILHWVMAVGIASLAIMGLTMTHLKLDTMRIFQLYQLHKSIGITVLLAAILRLGWRLTHKPPALPLAMPKAERVAAHAGHLVLYIFLFGLPLTGWALVSASVFDIPTILYGIMPWPHLPVLSSLEDKAPVEALLKDVHAYGAYALIAIVVGHAAAALRHHFILGDDVLTRMLPWRSKESNATEEQSA